ncbi:MAG: PAS domain S-box protein [Candidatus Hodarchaeota archaeon]
MKTKSDHSKSIVDNDETLCEIEEKNLNLFKTRGNFGVALIQNGVLRHVNSNLAEILNYKIEELVNTQFVQYLHPDFIPDIAYSYKVMIKSREASQVCVTKLVTKDGSFLDVELNIKLISYHGKPADLVTIRDKSEQKSINTALHETEEKYRKLVERANDGIIIIQDKLLRYVNPSIAKITGYTIEELLNTPFTKYVHPDILPILIKRYEKRMAGQNVPSIYETRLISKDGSVLEVEINAGLITYHDRPADLVIIRDITERKRIDVALRESEEKYRILVERANDGIVIIQDFLLKYVNPTLAEMLEYSPKEMLDSPFLEFVHSDVLPELVDNYMQFLSGQDIPHMIKTIVETKTKKIVNVELNAARITFQDRPAVLVIVRDITERKKTEEALCQVKQEEERYHAMLSHFINNDLQKIVFQLDILSFKYENNQKLDKNIIKRIGDIAFRASKTIETVNTIFDVLQSSFDNQINREEQNILEVINHTLSELQETFSFRYPIIINPENLNRVIIGDEYLNRIFYEILYFALSSNSNSQVIIEGFCRNSQFHIFIRDSCSKSIPLDACFRLSGKISDDWESQGHYIGISLASVILQHYGGELRITPSDSIGSEFELIFPERMLSK